MAIGLSRDLVRQSGNATQVPGSSPSGKARHRQIEAPPEQMHRAGLADKGGAKTFQYAVDRYAP